MTAKKTGFPPPPPEPSRTAEGGTTGFGENDGAERRTLLLCTCPRRLPLFLWIPVTPVIPAEGGTTGFGENDGAGAP